MSPFDATTFRVFGLWLHLSAVVVWVGAILGWLLVLLPYAGGRASEALPQTLETLGRRVYTVGWEALFVVVLTGIFNLLPQARSGRLLESDYLTPLMIKLGLVGGMVGLQVWQHGWLVSTVGGGEREEEFRQACHLITVASGLFLVLAAAAVWMGIQLRI